MSRKITTIEFAQKLNVTAPRIRQMIFSGELPAEKLGRDWIIDAEYVEVIKNRPETRGRKPYKKAA